MEQFLGLSRDSSKEKAESGTSPFNRNIVYNKKLGSISQENGFDFSYYIEGVIIGVYSTNKHVVYASILLSKLIITYVVIETNEIVKVIESGYLKYNVQRPIELVAWYNYKEELIVIFSDNVFENSSPPRLINLTNLNIPLVNYEFTSLESANLTLLFNHINQPTYKIEYGNASSHGCDLVFFTIAYILPDGVTRTRFVPVLAQAFPNYNFIKEDKREITFKINNLSQLFKQFIVGIVAYKDGGLFGYESNIINSTGFSYDFVFGSVSDLKSVAPETILVETNTFDKVKTMTIGNDVLLIGGTYKKPTNVYQKYANNIKLNLYFDYRTNNRHQAPLLCPDEVYYFTIALKRPDGTYTQELHIPNRDSIPEDLTIINKNELGLTDLTETNIKAFRVLNSGKWVNPSVGLPNFNNLNDVKLEFGYWENTELYPNEEAYNGTIDYDGETSLIGGRDLRNTPVKLHRIPGLDTLSEKFPMRLGMDIKNQSPIVNDKDTRLPAFSLDVDNFLEAFAIPIANNEIDGYRLSFVKKDGSSKIVSDNTFIKPIVEVLAHTYRKSNIYYDFDETKQVKYTQFGYTRVRSINMSVNKGMSSATIAKANFGCLESYLTYDASGENHNNIHELNYRDLLSDDDTKGNIGQYSVPVNDNTAAGVVYLLRNFSFKPNDLTQQYAVIKNIEQVPGNIRSKKNLFIHEHTRMKVRNSNTNRPSGIELPTDYGWNIINYIPEGLSDNTTPCTLMFYNPETNVYELKALPAQYVQQIVVNVTLLNLKKDIHQGLNPTEFVVIGATNINNPNLLFKDFGDTFTNNVYNEIFEQLGFTTGISPVLVVSFFQQVFSGMLSMHNNTMVSFKKDKLLGVGYHTTEALDLLVSFDYQKQVYTKETTRQLNTLIANTSFNYKTPFVDKFPYRLHKSLNLPSEALSTLNARSFLANAYQDFSNLRGIIIGITGFDKGVYVQQRYSLSIIQIKEKLNTNDENSAYLSISDLFNYPPTTIVDEDNKGYIGCVHQFSRKLTKEGFLAIDAERGRFYIIGQGPQEISKIKMENDFNKLLTPLCDRIVPTIFEENAIEDNPYNGNGVITGFDDESNRILITILNFKHKTNLDPSRYFLNGVPYSNNTAMDIKDSEYSINKSKTFSYNIDWKRWVAEHDYTPQFYFNTNRFNYGGINVYTNSIGATITNRLKGHTYVLNKINQKSGLYFYITDPTIYESYTDLLFNSRYDLSKWYKSVNWRTTVIDTNGNNNYFKTVDAIMFYTDYQCSGIIALDTERFGLVRNGEGLWTFNDFRDMVVDSDALPIDENGRVDAIKLHNNRIWFEKSDFISNFIVVRLIMYNVENTQIHIHNVNVEARISERN